MSAMSARPTEPMGYFGQSGQLLVLTEEQLLQQQQLLREKQEFDAWRASRAQARTQPQPEIISEGPIPAEVNVAINVDPSERSASVARARPKDQVTKKAKAKRAGSASTSRRSPSPKRDYPRGTCTVTRPSQASPRKAEHTVTPTPAPDLESFKAHMTSMLSDMLQASFQKFASQFNTNSGGQGDNSNEDTVPKQRFSEPTVDVVSDDGNDNSPQRGPEDQSEGDVTEEEADPTDSGLPTLEQLKMSEEEQQDYDASWPPQSRFLNILGELWEIREVLNLSLRTMPILARLALRQPRLNQLSQLVLIRDQSNVTQIRDMFSFVHFRIRPVFLSWCPKVKLKAKGQP